MDDARSATARMYLDEIARVRRERAHAIANTPLASVPLALGRKKPRRPFTIRASRQVMGYARKPKSNY